MTREELRHKYAIKLKATTSGTRISQLLLEYERELEKISFPPAEGAEAILHRHIDKQSMDELSVNVWPDMLEAMHEFATLHAQRIADKMVSERCKNCKYRGLPDSINEALNSGDGVYRP